MACKLAYRERDAMTANTTRRDFVTSITGVAIGSAAGATMATAQGASTNVRLFTAIIERGFNQGDLSVKDEVCATKLSKQEYLAKTDVSGPEILKDQIQTARGNTEGSHLRLKTLSRAATRFGPEA